MDTDLMLGALARIVRIVGRAIRDFFRTVFWSMPADPLKDLDEAFSPIDVDLARKRLRLVEDAARFGERGLPDPGDTNPDSPQERVIHFVKEEVANAFRRANREFERISDALKGRDISNLAARADRLPDELGEIIRKETRDAQNRVDAAAAQRAKHQRDLDRYKGRHGLDRAPRLRDTADHRLLLYGTILLALLQAAANATFFAQGMSLGLTAGLWFAIVLGISDVALHTLLGNYSSRVRAPDWSNRLRGALPVALVMFTVPFWNLGMVHLRLNIRRYGFGEGADVWWNSMSTEPWGFTDFGSFALLGIGVACSVLAVATGWSWDEPVPLFRELGRKIQVLEKEQDFWEERRVSVGHEERTKAATELEQILMHVGHNTQMAEALVARALRLEQNLLTFVRDAEHACTALLQTYRDENRLARSIPPPGYFRNPPPCRFEDPLDFDLSETRRFLKKQLSLRDSLGSRSDRLRERITTAGSPKATQGKTS